MIVKSAKLACDTFQPKWQKTVYPNTEIKGGTDTCRKTGMTVIVITHNQALTAMADRVIKIKNGKVESMHANPAPADVMSLEW